jgi:hypothetical protein
MTSRRRWPARFAYGWSAVALTVALAAYGHVDGGAGLLVGFVGAAACAAAFVAGRLLTLSVNKRRAGLLLVASSAAPSSYAWLLNVPALLVGLFLLFEDQPLAWARLRLPRR